VRLILKIAAGVFLGLVAVIFMLSVPRWIRERNEREMLKTQEARTIHALQVLQNLTPDKVIANCGEPVVNVSEDLRPTGGFWRLLGYERADGKVSTSVVIQFLKEGEGPWTPYGVGYGVNVPASKVAASEKDFTKLLDVLPCLEKK